jgi:hypothetical protein
MEELTDSCHWKPGGVSRWLGFGSVSGAVLRELADGDMAVIVYTVLPGYRANAVACARFLRDCAAVRGTMLDVVLGETVALPEWDGDGDGDLHSVQAAVKAMVDVGRATGMVPVHTVMRPAWSLVDGSFVQWPLQRQVRCAIKAARHMHRVQFLHGDFTLSAVSKECIIDLEMGTWSGRSRDDRPQLLSRAEIAYRFGPHRYVMFTHSYAYACIYYMHMHSV